jgi:alkylation response protein AidB-like acyl-CoA dehydrogenase
MSAAMDLLDTPQLEAFRAELRRFIADRAPALPRRAGFRSPASAEENRAVQAWNAALYAAGYLGADWPQEWGGKPDYDPREGMVVAEEIATAQLPPLGDQTVLAAFALLRFGSEEQKLTHLPAIRRGEQVWCQLFSEPDAGSDLAALRTRARRDGDVYVVDGQKVWSSNAQWSDFGFLLARSGAPEQRHRGITALILDMRLPGVEVRSLREITGSRDFNEVFLDGVRVPASCLLGEEGEGWRVAIESLGAERSGIGAGAARLRPMLRDLVRTAGTSVANGRPALEDTATRQDIGRFACGVEVANLMVHARLERDGAGAERPSDVLVGKLMYSELNLAMAEYAMGLGGVSGLVAEGGATDSERWQDEFLYARTYTIAGGSSEMMRNLLAERVLGMPREARG